MYLPPSDRINIKPLSLLFENMSECYKIFWFQALVDVVEEGNTVISYNDLINRMIVHAWYMVSEYKLNLGPSDTLETLVNYVFKISGLKSNEKKETLVKYLEVSEDKELIRMKRTLTYNVPYRLQAPFIKNFKGEGWKVSARSLAEKINHEDQLIYYYVKIDGLQSQLEVKQEWAEYIKRNYQILCGWIRYHMITYLQRRNPSVPGIVNKLEPPICRQLEKVKRYWRMVLDVEPIHEIYSGELLSRHEISIDHFVPWSYVAHDEFWNLHPTTRRINSSKSNNLPDWKYYFQPFSQLEYKSYQLMWRYEDIHEEFVKLQKEHVNSMEIRGKLYRKGLSRQEFVSNLEEIMLPVYQAAEHMGFKNWRCE